jgi:hypothetical protein
MISIKPLQQTAAAILALRDTTAHSAAATAELLRSATWRGQGVTMFWRVVFAGFGAFALGTACWAAWGLATPGDYFANGNLLCLPTLLGAVAIGAWVGYRFDFAWVRGPIILLVVWALYFHAFVPDGWWGKPPPSWDDSVRDEVE